ncbi:MAG: PH domain-containing protein [Promethearchaeota archaeon]
MQGNGMVIRPPIEDVLAGRTFRPSKAFRNKMWFIGIFVAIALWATIMGTFALVGYITFVMVGVGGWSAYWTFIDSWWTLLNTWYWVITAFWLIPGIIWVPIYINSIEYSVIGKSGEAMPEIYVKKGIINITKKHVPVRNVTHVKSVAGIFDRAFKIGTVEVETAGASGVQMGGAAEERLEGIEFFEELRDFILREMRRFKDPYVTGTEVIIPEDEKVIKIGATIEEEVLKVLYEIRELLRDRI